MKKQTLLVVALFVGAIFSGCKKSDQPAPGSNSHINFSHVSRAVYSNFPETFESGSKTAYAVGNVTLPSGTWSMDDALIGTLSTDLKNGSKSVRMRSSGKLTMLFDVTGGATQVTFKYGVFSGDGSSTFALFYSADHGSSWAQTGSNMTATSTFSTATFNMNLTGSVRFEIRKLTGGSTTRINIDDFAIINNDSTGGGTPPPPDSTTATRDDNMALGNPSGATTNTSDLNNYLMVKDQYTLSYNSSKGCANWVSWHLSTAWLGAEPRCDCYAADASLPSGFFKPGASSYSGSGFDRGHMCPSADRTASATDNSATFLMSNMQPQAPNLNQQTWEHLEDYSRSLAQSGKELYIISGGYGSGGTGSNGTATVTGGGVAISAHYWKIIVVLPIGINDVSRISASTRVIAVDMPNVQTVNAHNWDFYRTSVDAIESATGYDFLSNVPTSIQSIIEATVDNGPTS